MTLQDIIDYASLHLSWLEPRDITVMIKHDKSHQIEEVYVSILESGNEQKVLFLSIPEEE